MRSLSLNRQQIFFLALLGLSVLAANWSYRLFHGEYIVFDRAESLFRAGDYGGSIPLFDRARRLGLKSPRLLRRLADAYLATNNFAAALPLYEQLVKDHPGDNALAAKLAELYDLNGQPGKALAMLEALVTKQPESVRAWLWLAGMRIRQKDLPGAEQAFQKALLRDGKSAAALTGMGDVLAWTGRYPEAVQYYSRALDIDPKNFTARVKLARVLSWQGDMNKSIEQYRKALEDKP